MDWALLMHELVSKIVKALNQAKGTPLSSYLTHLYHHHEALREGERVSWEAQEKILQFGGTESDSDSDVPEIPEATEHPDITPEGSARSGPR